MGRWEPDAQGRLEQAALDLFTEHGFERTTTAQIARRAGLTERTFFRHYADKREVLFAGAGVLQELVVQAAHAAPLGLPPLQVVADALAAAGPLVQQRRERARQRQAVIAATPELQERELVKLASLSAVLAQVLRSRGVPDPAAELAASAGLAAFRVAFDRWLGEAAPEEFSVSLQASFAELRAVAREDADG